MISFTIFKLVVLALGVSSTCLGFTIPEQRRDFTSTGPTCASLAAASLSFLNSSNFMLTAFFNNLPNDNITGVPLVLGENGGADGKEFRVLSTFASFPSNDYPTINMINGGLVASGPDRLNAVGTAVGTNAEISFTVANPPVAPADIYCGIPSTSANGCDNCQFARLSIETDTDSFSLCRPTTPGGQVNVVYKADSSDGNCDSVQLLIIPN
ncbi:hypothetical protein C8Q75DRAFT_804978 [Abortiporus biennis]|nr:hypothetical protein C8Q75DRAFT_804978 [Abortiporus biennis]